MKIKKQSKNKSAGRFKHYKSYGWLASVVYRLRGDNVIRHYLKTGKYIQTMGEPYELIPGFEVQDLFIKSTVKRSRVKNIPDGCLCLPRGEIESDPMQELVDLTQQLDLYEGVKDDQSK